MARFEDWDDANYKWIKLGEQLQEAGWSQHDPRTLKRQLQAGRAVIFETNEQVSSNRTIYAFAVHWKKSPPEGEVQAWISHDHCHTASNEQLLTELGAKMLAR